jgi:acyl dehydratase
VIEVADVLGLDASLGRELAVSEWMEVPQSRIDRFASATADEQWIHVDPSRAAKESPYGAPIAHGFLTLSLMPALLRSAVTFPRVRMAINYGLNRVRFVSAVPSGARIRARFTPIAVTPLNGQVDVIWAVTVERDGGDKPCCVAEWVARYFV